MSVCLVIWCEERFDSGKTQDDGRRKWSKCLPSENRMKRRHSLPHPERKELDHYSVQVLGEDIKNVQAFRFWNNLRNGIKKVALFFHFSFFHLGEMYSLDPILSLVMQTKVMRKMKKKGWKFRPGARFTICKTSGKTFSRKNKLMGKCSWFLLLLPILLFLLLHSDHDILHFWIHFRWIERTK